MTPRSLPRTAALAAALLLSAPPAAGAQQRTSIHHETAPPGTWHQVSTGHGRRLEIRATGGVELSDDGRSVVGMAPGARLLVAEAGRGPERRYETWEEGGRVRATFRRDGAAREMDAADREWLARMVAEAAEGGLGTRERVARIRARGGVDAVLRESERLRTDSARRLWYRTLLAARTTPAETARILGHASGRIGSDAERRTLYRSAMHHAGRDAGTWTAILQGARTLGSDAERAVLLRHAAATAPFADARVRTAFFAAVAPFDSDAERGHVLRTVVRDARATPALAAEAIHAARPMESDAEKGRLLRAVRRDLLEAGAVADAYRALLRTFGSEAERSRAVSHLARSLR